MSPLQFIESIWVLSLFLQALWALRIWRAGQARRYPATLAYLAFSTFAGALTLLASANESQGHRFSLICYLLGRPLIWVLFFAVVHEMFRTMAKEYVGLRRVGELVLYGAVGSLVLFLVLVVITRPYSAPEANTYYRLWLIQEQSVYLATAIAVMAVITIGRFFSLPMSRNLRTIVGTLGIYFVCMGGMIVLRSYLGSSWNYVLDLAGLGVYCLCLAIGALAYSPAGEAVSADPRLTDSAKHLETLGVATRRLEEVNMQLVRVLAK
jgi:hypothetical protein